MGTNFLGESISLETPVSNELSGQSFQPDRSLPVGEPIRRPPMPYHIQLASPI